MNCLSKSFLVCLLIIPNLCLARPKFKSVTIKIGQKSMKVELALSQEERSHGLMHIHKLPKGIDGMLFVFPKEEPLSFWMKNTFIDLSIAFIDSSGKIINIQDMKATSLMTLESSLPHYRSPGVAKYALEVPVHWFEKNKIKPGTRVEIPKNF